MAAVTNPLSLLHDGRCHPDGCPSLWIPGAEKRCHSRIMPHVGNQWKPNGLSD